MSEEAEGEPEDNVSNNGSLEIGSSDGGRDLYDHTDEEIELESLKSDGDDEFVEHGGEKEDESGRDLFGATMSECRHVNVTNEPVVGRDVPSTPIVRHSGSVPPITVKLAITKAQKFSQNIEPQVEEGVENREPYSERGDRELENALKEVQPVALLHGDERVFNDREAPLLHHEDNSANEEE